MQGMIASYLEMSKLRMPYLYYTFCFKAILLLLLHITSFRTLTIATPTFSNNITDHMALIAIKSKISHDPQGIFKSWNDSIHFCRWEGITCSRRRERVTVLDLSSRDLVGSLSPSIGNMTFLRDIRLSNNNFYGDIPPEVGRLFRLNALVLTNNSFEGAFPPNLSHCSNLNILQIGLNKLEGKLPKELASMSKLTNLSIHYNHFTGGIPSFIGNLTALVALSTAYNDLGGSIPDALGRLKSLTRLGLGSNNLSGKVPPSIYNLSMLFTLSMAGNQLEGNIPWDMGLTLHYLTIFQIWGNHFSGEIPVTLSNASKLESVEMGINNFSGKITIPFGHLQHLKWLSLYENHLGSGEADEMEFITSLANCSKLEFLYLDRNQLQGRIPNSIANLSTSLMDLYFRMNNLFGDIPSGLENLVSLTFLGLTDNMFTGHLPSNIGLLKKLQYLDVSMNKLSGKIPNSLGNLTLLTDLYLDNNRISGGIPLSLGNCQNLQILNLSQNYLDSSIPNELFSIYALIGLGLSHNRLAGSLPLEVGKLRNLGILDLSDNMLSGEIPNSLSGCTSLEILLLDGNHFQGGIPQSLSSLRGIREIDLSVNNLRGKIPEYMETLALEYLNLSFNNFEGEIPTKGIFKNASAISVKGNKNLCGGIVELGLPKCSIKAKKKGGLSNANIIIIVFSLLGGIILSVFLHNWTKRKNREQSSGFSLKEPFKQLSYQSLLKATDGFSTTNLLGKGSFGSVYKGVLEEDGTSVAVKVLDLLHRGASKSFMLEGEALKNIRHRNLIKIITSCSSIDFQGNDFKALVYELMPKGSLENWLHPSDQETNNGQSRVQSLNLLQRINIAIDVASALDYLHYHCGKPIVHCDLKPSNVLLDNDMIAHVGDFGLARFILESRMPNQSSSIGVKGTIGYTAPEYGMGSKVSIQGDLYSYGILVLEMMTGKRPTGSLFEGGLNLHTYARMALPDQIMEIVDPKLLQEAEASNIVDGQRARNNSTMDCLVSMIRIGVACSMESPQDRMVTSVVLSELHLIRNNLLRNRANN